MGKNTHPIVNGLQYAALRSASAGMHIFSAQRNMATARMIGSNLYRYNLGGCRTRTLSNIHRAMPELPQARAEAVAEQSMQHLLRFGVEVLFTERLVTPDTWPHHIKFDKLDQTMSLILSDQPVLLVTPHYGNFEILGYLMAMLGIDLAAIARPIDNPYVNDWILGVREKHGLQIITKWGATEPMVDIMQRGGTLGFIGDQNAGDKGVFVPFFGRLASAYKSLALLAMNFNAPIVCGYARRVGDGFNFKIGCPDIIYPEDWADQPDPMYYITARYTRALEQMIREVPEQYWWVHRRWKSRPPHERKNKPMPARFRQRLLDLPWLDAQQVDAIDANRG